MGPRLKTIIAVVVMTVGVSVCLMALRAPLLIGTASFSPGEGLGELIPTLDNGTLPIEIVHTHGLRHRGVGVLMFNSQGHILVARRPAHMRTCPNVWLAPGEHSQTHELRGGAPFPFEREAAVRCLREEFSLHIIETRFFKVAEYFLIAPIGTSATAGSTTRLDVQDSSFFGVWLRDHELSSRDFARLIDKSDEVRACASSLLCAKIVGLVARIGADLA
jgi:hypothetical protein